MAKGGGGSRADGLAIMAELMAQMAKADELVVDYSIEAERRELAADEVEPGEPLAGYRRYQATGRYFYRINVVAWKRG